MVIVDPKVANLFSRVWLKIKEGYPPFSLTNLLTYQLLNLSQYNFTYGLFIFSKPTSPRPSPKWRGRKTPLIQLHKRIIHFLKPDCCHRAMTGINFCIVWQGEKFCLDTINQSIIISSGKVRSANASIE